MSIRQLNIVENSIVSMLSDEVRDKLSIFHMRCCMFENGCLLTDTDHGPAGLAEPIIDYAPSQRIRVFTGTRQTGSFNHHAQLAEFKGKTYFAFSNGLRDEESGGQQILICSSDDGRSWPQPTLVVGEHDTRTAYNCGGLFVSEDILYLITLREDTTREESLPGMRRIDPDSQELLVYRSTDGQRWEKAFTFSDPITMIFEAPRTTADGRLLAVAAMKDHSPCVLLWPSAKLCEHPKIIPIVQPPGAVFPYGEGSWYQTADSRIIVFWRDEGRSCHLWVNYSDDGGETFSEPIISSIPDSMSRIHAGRLSDGRYYLCGNAFPTLLNRMHLMLLLSDDGYEFNKVYNLIDDPTAYRLTGLLKLRGYQYPCCLEKDDILLIGYSVNKEDMECLVVDIKGL